MSDTRPPSRRVSLLSATLALSKGYAPRLLQARGLTLAAILIFPVLLSTMIQLLIRLKGGADTGPSALIIFHTLLGQMVLPVLALVAAGAGLREDFEQRTLPMMLTRATPSWMLPFGKGLVWYGWSALWILVAMLLMPALGASWTELPRMTLALLSLHFAQVAFISLFTFIFKRGLLWGALYFFVADPLVRILPAHLQRFTFIHYLESISGSRAGSGGSVQLLAQVQISTPWPLAILIMVAFGLICWGLCGYWLHRSQVGLSGGE